LPLLARWWWLLALGTIVAGVAGYGAVTQVPKTYQAEVQALVGPINTDVSLDASGALASTYADLATSQSVLETAIKNTGSSLSTLELEKATTAISNQVTRIVTISVESRDPTRAAQLANALARRLSVLSTEVDSASKSVLDAFQSQPEYQSLQPAVRDKVKVAANRVFGPSAAGRLKIIDPARPPESADKPVVPLVVLLSALGGLLITAIFVLFRESQSPPRAALAAPAFDGGSPPSAEPEPRARPETEPELGFDNAATPERPTRTLN
jgi:capsular polysaccharide biosynthesis protein